MSACAYGQEKDCAGMAFTVNEATRGERCQYEPWDTYPVWEIICNHHLTLMRQGKLHDDCEPSCSYQINKVHSATESEVGIYFGITGGTPWSNGYAVMAVA